MSYATFKCKSYEFAVKVLIPLDEEIGKHKQDERYVRVVNLWIRPEIQYVGIRDQCDISLDAEGRGMRAHFQEMGLPVLDELATIPCMHVVVMYSGNIDSIQLLQADDKRARNRGYLLTMMEHRGEIARKRDLHLMKATEGASRHAGGDRVGTKLAIL